MLNIWLDYHSLQNKSNSAWHGRNIAETLRTNSLLFIKLKLILPKEPIANLMIDWQDRVNQLNLNQRKRHQIFAEPKLSQDHLGVGIITVLSSPNWQKVKKCFFCLKSGWEAGRITHTENETRLKTISVFRGLTHWNKKIIVNTSLWWLINSIDGFWMIT